jgi:dipeptidyl aminopeptidase/acylaminoacyl peptidase
MKTEAPFGTWKSPITPELILSSAVGLDHVAVDGRDTYWTEMRPLEGGRYVLVRRTPDGETTEMTPAPFNVRTRVHEYGGGAFTIVDGTIYFAHFDDQRLYRQRPGQAPEAITPPVDMRYADLVYDRQRNRLLAVREDHTGDGEAVNTLVAIALEEQSSGQLLVSGNDFYAFPRLSPDGKRLAWITWNHPNMPWDGTELWLADVAGDGSLSQARLVAGGADESIQAPEWSPDGLLYFVSDRSGWWNVYRVQAGGQIEQVLDMAAEFGQPQWRFDMPTYAFVSAERVVCTYVQAGISRLALLDVNTGELAELETPYEDIRTLRYDAGRVLFAGASPVDFKSIVELRLGDGRIQVLKSSNDVQLDEAYLTRPQAIEFPTEGGLSAHAFFYPPKNPDFRPPAGEKPPLIVFTHGGPTGMTSAALRMDLQYWTSRGFGVVDVNYGGSTGYGREYRRRLNGQWGVVDVDDCSNAARYLVQQGQADGRRLAIRGGSAGGYTTLRTLTVNDLFQVGASYFGLSDLEVFVHDTHKFESRYLTTLVGPFPERADLYRERSPIYHVDQLSSAMILFQGLEDKIVPPNQAEIILEAVRAKGLPVAYLPFEGEQHGFRRAENMKRSMEAELYFYGKIFGFEPADEIEPVEIENL